jgi:hypothetical protein
VQLPLLTETDPSHYIQLESRKSLQALPKVKAVYGFWHPEHKWLYIGATSNLQTRFHQHHRLQLALDLGCCRLCWAECEVPKFIEMGLIALYQPHWNPPGSPRSFLNWIEEWNRIIRRDVEALSRQQGASKFHPTSPLMYYPEWVRTRFIERAVKKPRQPVPAEFYNFWKD